VSGRQAILIVDDRKENLIALRNVLSDVDADVVEATSGNEALAVTLDHQFALAIVDVMMPGMTGFELAEHLRGDESTRELPIVFVTAAADERNVFKGYAAGGIDYILKPFVPEVLLGKVRMFLEMDRYRRELKQHSDHLDALVTARTKALADRVESLRCLYGVSRLTTDDGREIEDIFAEAVALIPPCFRYPELACASTQVEDRKFCTANFRATDRKLSSEIIVSGETVGAVTVCYLEQVPASDEGPFLTEERELVIDVARQLGGMVQRRRAEAGLVAERLRLANVIKGTNVGTWEWNVQTGAAVVSERWAQIVGYTLEELTPVTAEKWRALMHPDDCEAAKEVLKKHFAGELDSYELESRLRHKDGHQVWAHIRGRVVTWTEDGKPLMMYGTQSDISDRKRAEEEREKLEQQLRVSQKMEAIGTLAGGVAHDFNNLLTVILSYTMFSMEGVREGGPLHDNLSQVLRASERAVELTRQLLAFSRKQVLQPVVLDLNRTVTGVQKMLRRILGEDIELVLALDSDLGLTLADAGQLEQVLMNLVVNARDAMPRGGRLTIGTCNVEADEGFAAHHLGLESGPFVALTVTDTGTGMDQHTKLNLFEPFFTTKEKGKGTGLGLSTVYGIVKQSGGDIWVYSEPGEGSTFKIFLPRDLSATVASNPRATAPPTQLNGIETVLVVEDDAALREIARRSLSGAGYTVLTAANGDEALRACAEFEGTIHLLLTDVVMPGMSGKTLAERLKEAMPRMKVVYMSGYADDALSRHGVLSEGTMFLSKPFSGGDLMRKVREALDSSHRSGHAPSPDE